MQVVWEQELRSVVSLTPAILAVIEDGFTRLSRGEVQTPPIMRLEFPEHNGEVDVKAARVDGLNQFAIKMSSGFFDNPLKGLRSGSGLMVVLSAVTGYPEALLMDNGYLTDVRTAAAGAVAAQYLANDAIDTVGIIGSGSQARWQLEGLRLVRKFRRVMVYSVHGVNAEALVREVRDKFGLRAEVAPSPEVLVRQSDIVVTCTPATQPVIRAEWLHPGLHITAMGSDAEFKQELDPKILRLADKVCCDLTSQCLRLGELHHAMDSRDLETDGTVIELGDLTSRKVLGRTHRDHVTVCDLTGTGVQDTMIAVYAFKRVMEQRGA